MVYGTSLINHRAGISEREGRDDMGLPKPSCEDALWSPERFTFRVLDVDERPERFTFLVLDVDGGPQIIAVIESHPAARLHRLMSGTGAGYLRNGKPSGRRTQGREVIEMSVEKEKTVNKTKVKEMGFSDRMIELLLPEPEEKRNFRYPGSPMKIWKLSDVLDVMSTERYAVMRADSEKKSLAARKGVAAKRSRTRERFDKLISEIDVEVVPLSQLRKEAICFKLYENARRNRYCDDPAEAPEGTMQRWMVNQVRHCHTDYDAALFAGKGEVGIGDERFRYKLAVLGKIAEAYPQLAAECKSQSEQVSICHQMAKTLPC